MVSGGKTSMNLLTAGMIMPRWMGAAAACATCWPLASNIAAEASRASLSMAEWELLRSVISISSAMSSSLLRITSSVMGSMAGTSAASLDGSFQEGAGGDADDEVAGRVELGQLPGVEDERRLRLLDYRRSFQPPALDQRAAEVDGHLDETADLLEVGWPPAGRRRRDIRPGRPEPHARQPPGLQHAGVHQLDRRGLAGVAVDAHVRFVEGL